MNTPESLRKSYEAGNHQKQDYIETIHALHARLFDYPPFIAETDVEALRILPEGVLVRSRSQQIELFLDPQDQHLVPCTLMNFRAYEMAETEFLKSVARDGWNILDIGANCGWHSLSLAKKYPGAQIHAFEPIPRTYEILTRNIRHNGFDNVHAHLMAFSDQETTLEFLYTPNCSGATSLTHAGQPTKANKPLQKIACPSTTLDLFCSQNGIAPQLIKCDVEGAELMVIKGGLNIISAHKPIILIELLRKWAHKFGYHPNDILTLLGGYGYQAFSIGADALLPCPVIDEETVETNFVLLHTEQHRRIIGA